MPSRLLTLLLAGLVLAACDTADPLPEPDPAPPIEGVYFAHQKSDDGVWTIVGRLALTQSGNDLTGEIELISRGPSGSGQQYNRLAGTYDHPRLRLDILPQGREIRGTVSEDGFVLALEIEYWALGDSGTMELRVREMTFERPEPYTPPAVLPLLSGTYAGSNSDYGTEEQVVMTLSEDDGVMTGTVDVYVPESGYRSVTPVRGRHDHPDLTLAHDVANPIREVYFVGKVSADGDTLTGRFGTVWYWPTYVLTRTD